MHRSVLATVKSAAVIVVGAFLAALGISGVAAQGADTATPAARPTPPSYTSQALGVLPGDVNSAGLGVNDAGSVVGFSSAGGLGQRAFYWDRPTGVLYQLTTSLPNSFARAIAGGPATAYAVGFEYSAAEPGNFNALIWKIVAPSPSGPITIDPITLDGTRSEANGVNDNGIAVGYIFVGELATPAIWSPNGTNSYARTDIALLPDHDSGVAVDINNDGIVVGVSHVMGTPPFQSRAFLRLLNGGVLELAPAQGDIRSEAEAVSDVFTDLVGNGFVYVAGTTWSASPPQVIRGVRWTVNVDTGAVVDQMVLSLEFATGVNGAGDVAGTSPPTRPHGRSATLWQAGSYITLAPPKGGRDSESLGLARTASSPTYVVGSTQMRGSRQAVVWEVD